MTESGAATEPGSLSVHINADARQVWTMLREPKRIAQWHGWDMAGLDEEIREIYFTDAIEAEDHKRLTMGDSDAFILEPVGDGVRLALQRGPESGEQSDEWWEDVSEGWLTFLQQLRFALERHPNDHRQTTYIGADSIPSGGLLSSLGLENLPEPGEAYSATLATGEDISGKVWFRSDRQMGLTVDGYADHGGGLLIVATTPSHPDGRPEGGSQVLISCYGLGARRLAEIRDGWEAWRSNALPGADPLVPGSTAGVGGE
jgi:hypothetical protein